MILSTTRIDTSINPLDGSDLWKSIPVYQRFPRSSFFFFFFPGQRRFKFISQSRRPDVVWVQGLQSLCLEAPTSIRGLCSKDLCKSFQRQGDPLTGSPDDCGHLRKWRGVKGLSAQSFPPVLASSPIPLCPPESSRPSSSPAPLVLDSL